MPNTFTQIHIHIITAVRFRESLIAKSWKERLHAYITGIVQNFGHKMISINSMPDHLHFLFGCRPTQSISDLMELLKGKSSTWVNDQRLCKGNFRWQEGYGAFSYAKSQLPNVCHYIENQELHHRKKTFREEYIELLEDFEVEFDQRFIFNPLE